MPGNLQVAEPVGVLPQILYTSFEESRIFPMLTQTYHDSTVERYLIQDGVNAPQSIRAWRLSTRLTSYADTMRAGALQLATFRDFYSAHLGGLIPFYWYHPFETDGALVGSNYDATGDNEIGRHVVRFLNASWNETTDMSLTNVSFELQEIA
ncbi:MAG TPA: hypothetical protein VGN17_00400 [Bryobacteraceae bacterium]|jgi:hypothetical protein